jgi:hypothetical protein
LQLACWCERGGQISLVSFFSEEKEKEKEKRKKKKEKAACWSVRRGPRAQPCQLLRRGLSPFFLKYIYIFFHRIYLSAFAARAFTIFFKKKHCCLVPL